MTASGRRKPANPLEGLATAASLKVPSVFHYQSFNEKWLRAAVCDRTIRFSNPKDFNDPWDCRPWYEVPSTSDERRKLIQQLRSAHQKHYPNRSRTDRRLAAKRVLGTPALMKQEIEKLSIELWEAMQLRYRVYCLSTKVDSPLMWGHYANKHQGICLEFGCDNSVFGSAMQVEYADAFPTHSFFGGREILPFVAKSDAWVYESEFRLVSEERIHATNSQTLKTDDGYLVVPKGSLRSVIVGALADDRTRKQVQDIVSLSATAVSVDVAALTPNRYEIHIQRARR